MIHVQKCSFLYYISLVIALAQCVPASAAMEPNRPALRIVRTMRTVPTGQTSTTVTPLRAATAHPKAASVTIAPISNVQQFQGSSEIAVFPHTMPTAEDDRIDGDCQFASARLSIETFLPQPVINHGKQEFRATVSIPFNQEGVLQNSVSMLKTFFDRTLPLDFAVEWQVPNALLALCAIPPNLQNKEIHISVCDLGFITQSSATRLLGLLTKQQTKIQAFLPCAILFDRIQVFIMRDKPNGTFQAMVPGFDRIIFALGIANSTLNNIAATFDSLFDSKRGLPYEPHITLAMVSNIEHAKAVALVREFARNLSEHHEALYPNAVFTASETCFKGRNISKKINALP